MYLKVAIIITAVSIGLLVIYGADVAAGGESRQGFLPLDQKARGIELGIPGAALPIIAYFISRNESSKGLGVMIIISGLLIAIGSAGFLAVSNSIEKNETTERNVMAEFGPVIAVGAFITALGAIKIKKSPLPVN